MHDFQETVKYTDGEWRLAYIEVKTCLTDSLIQQCICRCFLKPCIIKQLLDSVFVICGIIKVSVSVISLCQPSALAANTYLDLDFFVYH